MFDKITLELHVLVLYLETFMIQTKVCFFLRNAFQIVIFWLYSLPTLYSNLQYFKSSIRLTGSKCFVQLQHLSF